LTTTFERISSRTDAMVSHQREHIRRVLRLAPLLSMLDTRLRVTAVDDDIFLAHRIHGPDLRVGSTYNFIASGGTAASAFRAQLRAVSNGEYHLTLPATLVQSGFRISTRRPISDGMTCGFRIPHEEWITARVKNASRSGVALSFDMPLAIEVLASMELSFFDGAAEATGVVRHCDGGMCGIELVTFASPSQRHLWNAFTFRLVHPRLDAEASRAPRLAYRVLESSGYIDRWIGGQDGAVLASEHSSFWDSNDSKNGRLITLLEDERPIATMAANQLYPHTWLLHHFAVDARARIDRTAFRSYAREVYSGMLHELQRIDALEYVTMNMEADTSFNEFLYGEFVRMYPHPEALLWGRNRVYRGDTRRPLTETLVDRFVRTATDGDLCLLADVYTRTLHPMQVAALALTTEELSPAGFARKMQTRARQVFVYAPEGAPVYAVMCETGNEGMNLFGLANRCGLTALVPLDADGASVARRALLRRALCHFAAAGKRQMVLFEAECESAVDPTAEGFTWVSDGVYWLSRREVLPAWRSYVEDALS
jgi:hypothetical protein